MAACSGWPAFLTNSSVSALSSTSCSESTFSLMSATVGLTRYCCTPTTWNQTQDKSLNRHSIYLSTNCRHIFSQWFQEQCLDQTNRTDTKATVINTAISYHYGQHVTISGHEPLEDPLNKNTKHSKRYQSLQTSRSSTIGFPKRDGVFLIFMIP